MTFNVISVVLKATLAEIVPQGVKCGVLTVNQTHTTTKIAEKSTGVTEEEETRIVLSR